MIYKKLLNQVGYQERKLEEIEQKKSLKLLCLLGDSGNRVSRSATFFC